MADPMAHDLEELAVRCEQAGEPDRDLDRWITLAMQGWKTGSFKTAEAWIKAATDLNWAQQYYTSSLDAAMTLVPETWRLRQINFSAPCADDRRWHVNLHGGREGENTFVGRGATRELAMCAASLRARALIDAKLAPSKLEG